MLIKITKIQNRAEDIRVVIRVFTLAITSTPSFREVVAIIANARVGFNDRQEGVLGRHKLSPWLSSRTTSS